MNMNKRNRLEPNRNGATCVCQPYAKGIAKVLSRLNFERSLHAFVLSCTLDRNPWLMEN